MHPATFLASFTYSSGQEIFMLTTEYKIALEKKLKINMGQNSAQKYSRANQHLKWTLIITDNCNTLKRY